MNIPRLNKLRKTMEMVRDQNLILDMTYWTNLESIPEGDIPRGTRCCAAGWYCLLNPNETIELNFSQDLFPQIRPKNYDGHWMYSLDVVKEHFGLKIEDARNLFVYSSDVGPNDIIDKIDELLLS